MKKFKVKIKGVTPYMQHRMDDKKLDEWEKERGAIIERAGINKEDSVRAEFHCYRDGSGCCYLPSEHLRGAMIAAGSFIKAKVGNATKSMKNIVAAMFFVDPENIILPDYDCIDKRSAVNRNIKARVITIRPKWSIWSVEFNLLVDNDTISQETVKSIVEYAGKYVGVGSFRPANSGQFGRFEVERINEIQQG